MTGFVQAGDPEQQSEWIRGRQAFADADTDALITTLLGEALAGTLGVEVTSERRLANPKLTFTSTEYNDALDLRYSPDAQIRRGAQLPTTLQRSRLGFLNLPRYIREFPRAAFAAASTSPAEYRLTDAVAVTCWSVLIPALETLLKPFRLRGDLLTEVDTWDESVRALVLLGFDVSPVDAIAPRSGYAGATTDEQLTRRRNALAELAQQVPSNLGERYRAMALCRVAEKYYTTRRRDGTNTRKRVLTTKLAPDLTAGCLGDWEVFLAILGEPLAKDERILRDIVKVDVDLDLRAGGPVEHINERIGVLKRVWDEIDALQASASLSRDHGPRLSRWTADDELLPRFHAETQRDIRALWGTQTATRSIDRIVSCHAPAARMLEGLTPALDLWDELLDDAWRVANGYHRPPDSGTLEQYEPVLARLDGLGTPVNRNVVKGILDSLESARTRIPEDSFAVGFSVSLTEIGDITTRPFEPDTSQSRQVFTEIRDLVTSARRHWAQISLDRFLSARWRSSFEAAATDYGRRLAVRDGKPPTMKQSAPIDLINLWFAGEVEPYYRLIGHPRDHAQVRSVAVVNVEKLVESTMQALGVPEVPSGTDDGEAAEWSPFEEHDSHLYAVPHDIKRRVLDIWRDVELGEDPAAADPPPHIDHVMRDVAAALKTSPEDAWRQLTAVVLELLPEPSDAPRT